MHQLKAALSSSRRMLRTLAQGLFAVMCCTHMLPAQTTLRVLRYAPTDTASAGSIISVTFNRPVAGMLDETIVASDVMTIEPSVKGTFEWRDPITLRFLPSEPLPPASTFVVSVDTAAIARAGKRSAAGGRRASQFQFTIRVPGPKRLLSYASDQDVGGNVPVLGPVPAFRVLYSSAIDLEAFTRLSRLEFPPECGGTIPLRTVGQRDVGENTQSFRGWTDVDPESVQFYRWVDMTPRDSLRPGCKGTWVVPLFNDARGRTTDRHAIRTSPEFRIDSVESCIRDRANPKTPCDPNGIIMWFSAPVSSTAIGQHVSASPELGHPAGTGGWSSTVVFSQRLVPRQQYTVTVDSAIRDIYGRKLQGPRSISVLARDRLPGLLHQSHLVTLSRSVPVLKLRTVNVDTLTMFMNVIPDSLTSSVLGSRGLARRAMADKMAPALPAAHVISIPVNGKFNEEQEVSVTLPQLAGAGASPLTAVRFEMKARSIASDSTAVFAARRADSIRYAIATKIPTRTDLSNFNLLAQVSDLRAHSKISEDNGVVFVTDVNGRPVDKAAVSLFDEYRRLRSSGTTNRDGLTTLTIAPRTPVPVGPAVLAGHGRTRYLEVTHGRDRLITSVETAVGNTLEAALGPWSLAERVRAGNDVHGAMFTDRGIYRPGETVFVKTYVRLGIVGSIAVPPPDSLRVSMISLDSYDYVQDDDDQAQTSIINEYGSAADSIHIPANAKLGRYLLSTRVGGNGEWWDFKNVEIRVAEFRAPDFVVDLKPDTAMRYVGDSVRVGVAARYLFGMPMRNARLEWTATARRSEQPAAAIPNTRGYRIGEERWWEDNVNPEYSYSHGTHSLDDNGNASIVVATTASAMSGAAQAKIDIGVTDVNNQSVTKTIVVKLHPASVSVAAKPRNNASTWKTGAEQIIDVLVVRSSGERISGVPVSATIVRRRWVTGTSAPNSAYRWVADTVQRLAITSSRDSVALRFTPASDGAYDIRLEARDENGRVTRTNFGQWAYANPWISTFGTNPAKLNVSVRQHDRPDFRSVTRHTCRSNRRSSARRYGLPSSVKV